jgi:SPP1 gp7 family putative phage head morphogenesis protein
MRYIISQGLTDGLGVDEIGRNLRKYFDDMSVARAKTIARTETGRLVSLATNEAYRQSAFVTGKEWLTARDDRVRPEHQLNDRKVVAVDGIFPNGESYPGEKSINCRCAIAPAI